MSHSNSLPPELLQWLFRVLQPEYADPRVTYQDVAVTLQKYSTLRPRTRIYTSEFGDSKLLLCLFGSLPCTINQRTYKIPIELWVPQNYPVESPIVYVVPTEKIALQPGNHVDNSGKCYLPYLSDWRPITSSEGTRSNIVNLLLNLAKVFSHEPPVYAKPLHHSPNPSPTVSSPVLRAPIPRTQTQTQPSIQTPNPQQGIQHPDLPPKGFSRSSIISDSEAITSPKPPPLPPLPEDFRRRTLTSPTLNKMNHESQKILLNQPISISNIVEQPNVMDDDTIGEINDNERERVLKDVASSLQSIYDTDVATTLNKFDTSINQIKYSVEKFDQIFQYEFHNLDKVKSQIHTNEAILQNSIKSAQETIGKAENHGDVNIDEIIIPESVLHNQLYELVTEDLAITDTLNALNQAFDNGKIPLNNFVKHTRNLAREQFLKKALILKISNSLNLHQ